LLTIVHTNKNVSKKHTHTDTQKKKDVYGIFGAKE